MTKTYKVETNTNHIFTDTVPKSPQKAHCMLLTLLNLHVKCDSCSRISIKQHLNNLPVPQQGLKGQRHVIFDLQFFRQSIISRPLINTLKYFRILFRIRRAIRPLSLIQHYAA
jgi:hypothetical protein